MLYILLLYRYNYGCMMANKKLFGWCEIMRIRPYTVDLLVLVLLFLLVAFYAIFFVDFHVHPIEDAAMLMRYSQHFADGHGIVWNIGEAPVDGATDFLFMITIGVLVKVGLSLEFATRFLGFAAHFLTIGVIFLSLRRTFNVPILVACGSALFLVAGPGFFYVVSYFGTTVFALFACISWWIALNIVQYGENQKKSLLFAFASLVTGLIRPEGVLLTGLMLLVLLFIKGWKNTRITFLSYTAFFLVFGGAYFLWRWNYFGYPLPNPFYIKGGGVLHYESLVASYAHTFFLNIWLLPAFVAGIFSQQTRRKAIGFLILIFGFATFFILLANNMNVLGRFQYVTLPLTLMVFWPLTQGLRNWLKIHGLAIETTHQRFFYSLLVIIFFVSIAKLEHDIYNIRYHYDGKYYVAAMLSKYKDSGYRLATSEAGLLPLYSQWKSLDTWGLNNQWIAHHGRITDEYLEKFNPHIIMFYAHFSPVASSGIKDNWQDMIMVLKNYAERHGYILAAAYSETPYAAEYYYVRPDFPESEEIIRYIREMDYPSYISGVDQTNYANELETP